MIAGFVILVAEPSIAGQSSHTVRTSLSWCKGLSSKSMLQQWQNNFQISVDHLVRRINWYIKTHTLYIVEEGLEDTLQENLLL